MKQETWISWICSILLFLSRQYASEEAELLLVGNKLDCETDRIISRQQGERVCLAHKLTRSLEKNFMIMRKRNETIHQMLWIRTKWNKNTIWYFIGSWNFVNTTEYKHIAYLDFLFWFY